LHTRFELHAAAADDLAGFDEIGAVGGDRVVVGGSRRHGRGQAARGGQREKNRTER